MPPRHREYVSDAAAAEEVRFLARRGELARRVRDAGPEEFSLLHRGGYVICWPVVFQALTRGLENGRGHHRCGTGPEHLRPECLDRFGDDVESVVIDFLTHADKEIHNVEGWIRSRINRATVDMHRRRRGERGAVQRPRMPKWLAANLAAGEGDQRWLTELALNIQTWVGVTATAGTGLWPYGAWTERRIVVTGDPTGTERDVIREVDVVLDAMRRNARWYRMYIERPLGRKQAPVLPAEASGDDPVRAHSHLSFTQPHEAEDALLSELAAAAIDAIADRIARGEDPRTVVEDIVRTVFGAGTGADEMDRVPGAGSAGALFADKESVNRIVGRVLAILDLPEE
jgi:hypothetical protein